MDDLISRKALIEKCEAWHGHGWQHSMCLEKDIRNAPSIDAEPVRHGYWTEDGCCSECGEMGLYNGNEEIVLSSYCPYCGEKMDVKEA